MRSALLVGFGAWAFTWGALLAKANDARPHVPGGAFSATVTGAERAVPRGEAAFGTVGSADGSRIFTITLGAHAKDGAVVISSVGGETPRPGAYRITEVGTPGHHTFHAPFLPGSAEHPTGAYRAESGVLEVFSASAEGLEGRFEFDAADDEREVAVSGWFTAQAD
jgi:hypothetical protein